MQFGSYTQGVFLNLRNGVNFDGANDADPNYNFGIEWGMVLGPSVAAWDKWKCTRPTWGIIFGAGITRWRYDLNEMDFLLGFRAMFSIFSAALVGKFGFTFPPSNPQSLNMYPVLRLGFLKDLLGIEYAAIVYASNRDIVPHRMYMGVYVNPLALFNWY